MKLENESRDGAEVWLWLILLLCFATAVSSQSLWIDELLTAMKAREPTLPAWWQRMVGERQSDLQMPLYMFLTWVQAKVFGTSEWALRAYNLPWMIAGAVAFVRSFTMKRERMAAMLLVAMCPFGWYYLNEARPYAMQMGGGLLVLAALRIMRRLPKQESQHCWFSIFCIGIVVISGSSMLGMIWAGGAMAALLVFLKPSGFMQLLWRYRIIALITVGMLLALGFYYLWTLKVGARASGVAGTDWQNIVFIFYELTGFNGLGPGRIELRESGAAALGPYLGWIGIYGVMLFLILVSGLKSLLYAPNKRQTLAACVCLLLPLVFIIGSAVVTHFRLLGRHFTPLLPVVITVLVFGISNLCQRPWAWKISFVAFFIGLNLISCLSVRFALRHVKDDYRTAAAVARTALQQGRSVLWNAAFEGTEYYYVPAGKTSGKQGEAIALISPTREALAGLSPMDMAIVSKPDIYDRAGTVAQYLVEHGFVKTKKLAAFTIWERSEAIPAQNGSGFR